MTRALGPWATAAVGAALVLACGDDDVGPGGGGLECTPSPAVAQARCVPVDDGPDVAVTDEADAPAIELPDPLVAESGQPVTTAGGWNGCRRGEILRQFETEVYGTTPQDFVDVRYVEASQAPALAGRAVRKEGDVILTKDGTSVAVELLLYVPTEGTGPYPVVLDPNYGGNHLTHPDPAIRISARAEAHFRTRGREEDADKIATMRGTGPKGRVGAVERIVDHGYAFATFYYGDLHPDYNDGSEAGVHRLLPGTGADAPDRWGAIGAWAYGLSRVLDYLLSEADIDGERTIVTGSGVLGKAALWAAAQDDRFAAVFAHLSGIGGAALSRRRFNKTVQDHNHEFPYWFTPNFACYNRYEDRLPVDQHMLVALIAPRPVLLGTAVDSKFDDPRGTFLTALSAHPVYVLLGSDGLAATVHPGPDQPVMSPLGYYLRSGMHEITEYDVDRLLEFADNHVKSP